MHTWPNGICVQQIHHWHSLPPSHKIGTNRSPPLFLGKGKAVHSCTALASISQKRDLLRFNASVETSVESVNTATGIYQLLSAGKERMAFGANFNPDVLFGGTGLKLCTTGATNGRFFVVGMDSLFHWVSHLFPLYMINRTIISQHQEKSKLFSKKS